MEYENRLLFFVDILGFKSLLESSSCDKIYNLLTFVREFYKDEAKIKPDSKSITLFSDSIIISIALKNQTDVGEMFLTFIDFQNLIVNLILRGIFVRGAISYGDVHHDENLLFGPAFVEAYLTEKDGARFPRVICSESVIGRGDMVAQFIKENDEYEGVLVLDEDGFAYIDYFSSVSSIMDSEEQGEQYIAALRTQSKEQLELAITRSDTSTEAKYRWVQKKIEAAFGS